MTVDPRSRHLAHTQALVIWGGFLAAQLLFVGLLLADVVPPGRSPPRELVTVFGILALGAGIGAHVMWRRARAPLDRVMREAPDPVALLPLYVIAWALDETIAVLGLVLGLLGFPLAAWGAFSAAAFLLTLVHRPG